MRNLLLSFSLFTTTILLAVPKPINSADVNKVLANKDDEKLCDELFDLMIKHYGNDFDVSKCNEKDQHVILSIQASGIIDNGGFQYLFEGNFNGDPFFARTAAAFKSINALKCATAVDEALKLFSNSKPPKDIKARLKIYQAVPAAKREAIDGKFFSESKSLYKILGKYIRENREDFKHLK